LKLGRTVFSIGKKTNKKADGLFNATHVSSSSQAQFYILQQSLIENSLVHNVKEVMDTWTLQMNYPVVKVTYNSAGQITISQHRYLQDYNATDPGKYTSPFG
jgi:hypothetical protein